MATPITADYAAIMIEALITGTFGGLGIWVAGLLRDYVLLRRDKKSVFNALSNMLNDNDRYKTRSARSISNETNLTEERVIYVCSKHENIKRAIVEEKNIEKSGVNPDRPLFKIKTP